MADRFLSPPLRFTTRQGTGNDARILRDRQAAQSRAADRAQGRQSPFITARQLVQVYDGGSMGAAAELYYLGHPVLVTGAEAEGGTATLTVDSATTIPVVVLGHAPSVGDFLTAYAVGGRWVAERGGSSGGGGISCLPCVIPAEDLTVSWVNLLSGDGSAPLIYTTGPSAWTASCVDDGLIFKLGCNSGNIELRITFFIAGDCPDGESNYCSNFGEPPFQLTLASHTCSPFSLTFTVGEDACPAVYGAGNTVITITL
jgi:hypothetical protein